MVTTTVHPHKVKGFVFVAVVAIDLDATRVHLVAGTLEPASDAVPQARRPGLVPSDVSDRLLAVWNGGFMARHGKFGMKVGADTFVPPRDDACTVALYDDDSIRVATWPALSPTTPSMRAYRQTPPCLVEKGALHADLDSEYGAKKWGSAENGDRDIRRSALGVDATGRVLFYGMGEWVNAKMLAVAMKAAGAAAAAELDINWSYTRFVLFGRAAPDKPLEATTALVPKTKYTARGYVEKPAERDFFYLERRR
jgi:hypothetical protein